MRTPLLAAIPKLIFPWLVIFPGMAAAIFLNKTPQPRFDYALPILMRHYYGYGLMGLGVSAILASLMSGLAGNITAFSALCTHDLYQSHLRPRMTDAHYLRVGRILTALAACLSIATAYIVLRYNNLMDYLQLIFSLFNAPVFAVFVFGMFTRWATPTAGFWGILCGVIAACAHSFAVHSGIIVYGSQLSGDFYGAIFGWIVAAAVTAAVSLFTTPKPAEDLDRVTYFSGCMPRQRVSPVTWGLVAFVLTIFLLLNFIFR